MDAAIAEAVANAIAAERERTAAALARLAIVEGRDGNDGAARHRFPDGATSALASRPPVLLLASPSTCGPRALEPFRCFDCGSRPLASDLLALSAADSLHALDPDVPLHFDDLPKRRRRTLPDDPRGEAPLGLRA